jgi:hypothetical protein
MRLRNNLSPRTQVDSVKRIWKVFWILLIITVIELGIGYHVPARSPG